MEAREQLSSISACTTSAVRFGSPHYVKDSQCSRVPRVKNLTRKVNFANFNFAVRSQPRENRDNLPSYGIPPARIVEINWKNNC